MPGLPVLVRLENALGADLLRADLLGTTRPLLDERYTLQSLLGRGARGVVVQAHDTRLGRELAIKLLPEALTDASAVTEARALAKLEHPNVVRVYDCDTTTLCADGAEYPLSYVCMQLVRGATLRSWLATGERSLEEILLVFRAVGEGLAAAHDAGLVHRDVKPENVVVAADGSVKVIDFGFASPTESGSGTTAGTRAYLAPEVGRGIQTAASDQYAFAIALEEAIGERDVPTYVTEALSRARSHEPSKRHPSMRALLRALAPSRRRAWIAAGVGIVALACAAAFFALRREATPPACARAVGAYSFTGHVTSFVGTVNHERWSAYRLKLRPRGACRFDVELAKYTDDRATGFYDWRGTMEDVAATLRDDGRLAFEAQVTLHRPNKTEPYEHAFDFTLEGDRLTGTFEVLDRRDGFARVYGGTLVGRRDRGTSPR